MSVWTCDLNVEEGWRTEGMHIRRIAGFPEATKIIGTGLAVTLTNPHLGDAQHMVFFIAEKITAMTGAAAGAALINPLIKEERSLFSRLAYGSVITLDIGLPRLLTKSWDSS